MISLIGAVAVLVVGTLLAGPQWRKKCPHSNGTPPN